jgi:hypothetical protein
VRRLPDLDRDGRSTTADMARLARTDDLTERGWEVTRPARDDDGYTRMRARKRFGTPGEAATVLAEIAGDDGPFRGFRIERDPSFTRTTYAFHGTVDFSGGLESLGDERLADELGGEVLGEDQADIERRLGASLSRVVGVRIAVRLPGAVESNAPTQADNGAVWQPQLGAGEPARLAASSEVRHVAAVAWLVVAAAAALALVLLVLVRLAMRVR